MNTKQIIDDLKTFGNIYEPYEVKQFCGYRNAKDGEHKKIEITILDMGEDCDNPMIRYACQVKQEDGKKATGNNAPTVDEAIAIVHWTDLDK